jgi:hypothetical protein
MLSAIKSFFISVLVAVGIVSSPVVPPAQEILNPEPQTIVEDKEVLQVAEETQPEVKTPQNTPKLPSQSVIIQNTEIVTNPIEISNTEEEPEQIEIPKINGQCGGSANKKVTIKPTENLCSQGEASSITQDGSSFVWKCLGSGGGKDSYSCRAPIITDGMCGSLANTIVPQNYDKNNLCSAGSYTNPQTIGNQLQWTCSGEYGGQNTACYATKALTQNDIQQQNQSTQQASQQSPVSMIVNGACGYAHNRQTIYQPVQVDLCSAGTSSGLNSNTGSWKWSCVGSGGGSTAQCASDPTPIKFCNTGFGILPSICP